MLLQPLILLLFLENVSNINEILTLLSAVCLTGDEADKENDFLQHIGCPYTPLKRTSQIVEASPPLSVKLKSLARALLPLSPVDTNVPSPSPLVVKTPNDLPRVLDSTFCTPNFVEAETPYERFSKSTAKIRVGRTLHNFLSILSSWKAYHF